jgi:hypothetical protein
LAGTGAVEDLELQIRKLSNKNSVETGLLSGKCPAVIFIFLIKAITPVGRARAASEIESEERRSGHASGSYDIFIIYLQSNYPVLG